MGTFYSPNIVTNGLTLFLDSMNLRSYPGSGTSWFDLSGNGNTGTLTAFTGASAGSTSGFDTNTGYMMFDRHVGTSDTANNNRVTIESSSSLQQCLSENGVTVEFWLRMDSYYCTALTRWSGPFEIYYCGTLVHRTFGTNAGDGDSGYSYTNQFQKFHQIVATHNGVTRTLYVNNVNVLSDTNIVSAQDSSAQLPLGGYTNGNYAFVGAIPIFKVYNRVLTSDELTQNFNAIRGRFNV